VLIELKIKIMSRKIKTLLKIGSGFIVLSIFSIVIGLTFRSNPFKSCNVARISIAGELFTSPPASATREEVQNSYAVFSSDVVTRIDNLNQDKSIKAILIDIDSGGGSPVAGEEIANALKRSSKPTVAIIHGIGASAAYWVATGANTIFASSNSEVGSIGVVFSYLENVQKNLKDGLTYDVVSTGQYKLLGDPNIPLSSEGRALLQRDANKVYANFTQAVSENRNLPIEKVKELSNGATYLGDDALAKRLIDYIGDINSAAQYLSNKVGGKIVMCQK